MAAFFSSLNYKDSNYGQNDGYISNIQVDLSDGVSPLVITATGPFGYTAGPFVEPPGPIPDLTGLEPGTYTLIITDDVLTVTTLDIVIAELPEVILVANIADTCDCGDCQCIVDITSYIHNSNGFTYNLYLNSALIDTFSGVIGDELYQFTGLCSGDYIVEAIETDSVVYTYIPSGNCIEGTVTITPNDIITSWDRWCAYAPHVIPVGSTYYVTDVDVSPGGTGLPSAILGSFFDPANPSVQDADATSAADLEGFSGTPFIAPVASHWRWHTQLLKYLVVSNGLWVTFNPTRDQSNILVPPAYGYGNPTAFANYTTNSQWNIVPLTNQQYTIDGSNTVVLATAIPGSTDMVQCTTNTNFFNGFYSECSYVDYIHQVTLGSTDQDNDDIGIVLAAFKDTLGTYGPVDFTHTLSLRFNNENVPSVGIYLNIGNSAFAFSDELTQPDPLLRVFSGLIVSTNSTPFLGTCALEPPTQNSNGYDHRGNVRIKVEKTGTRIKVSTTQSMGIGVATNCVVVPPGGNNPMTLLFDIDLTDMGTWINAPTYATLAKLEMFLNPVKIGYLTGSQVNTQFFHIDFIGTQTSYISNVDSEDGATVVTDFPPCPCYKALNCDGSLEQIIFNTLPQTNLDVNLIYTFIEYPDKCWTIEISTDCKLQEVVTVNETFVDCEECLNICYELVDCQGLLANIITHTDLSQYVGKVIKISGCPDTCWTVSEIPCPIDTVSVYVINHYATCELCLPVVEVIPVPALVIRNRTVKPGYDTPGCSPEYVEKISCNFSEALFQEAASRRYGIQFCCNQDLNKWMIKKELLDLAMITDPDICKTIVIECCPPCNVEAELLVFETLSCAAPTNITSEFIPPIIPNCINVRLQTRSDVTPPQTVDYFDCCGEPQTVIVSPGNVNSPGGTTICIDLNMPYGPWPNPMLTATILGTCNCNTGCLSYSILIPTLISGIISYYDCDNIYTEIGISQNKFDITHIICANNTPSIPDGSYFNAPSTPCIKIKNM